MKNNSMMALIPAEWFLLRLMTFGLLLALRLTVSILFPVFIGTGVWLETRHTFTSLAIALVFLVIIEIRRALVKIWDYIGMRSIQGLANQLAQIYAKIGHDTKPHGSMDFTPYHPECPQIKPEDN